MRRLISKGGGEDVDEGTAEDVPEYSLGVGNGLRGETRAELFGN